MDHSRNRYYVSIHSGETMGEVLQQPDDSSFQFEIEATQEELQQLNNLIGNNSVEDMETFWDSHIPFLAYNQNRENDGYDRTLQQVYQLVYQLGTPQTRKQLEAMGIWPGGSACRE
ncbi:hypothetical protein [Desmospora activa]|uniref:Hydrolase n=1 Tax=Desmospora activa DSM 45169 TaxID=1121389 RepID=A0A2T4Z7P6_9BACL|nr:hypothetical protein [Desmospora activa]PTM57917.1 hypothetical protein C8J48_0483 [Desmospora activa DSM 45169]